MSTNPRCAVCGCYHAPRCKVTHEVWPASMLLSRLDLPWQPKAGDVPDMLDDVLADRWAVKLGLHPEQVWPGWCEAGLTYGDDVFVNGGGWRQAWEWAEAQTDRATEETAA